MSGYDFRSPRLFVDAPLEAGRAVALDRAQAHYLSHVLRLKAGDRVLAFNGRDGEWSARLEGAKRTLTLAIGALTRQQTAAGDLHYLFAPLKAARLDYMVQKAVEMGASRLEPVLTRHSQLARVNLERMRANAVEAAEQCGILTVPEIAPSVALNRYIAQRDPARCLVFCDEDADAIESGRGAWPGAAAVAACGFGWAGGRICRRRARRASEAAECCAAFAGPAHSARRHRGSGGARFGAGGDWRLALAHDPEKACPRT